VRVAPDGKRTYSNIDAKDWGYKIDQAKRLWGHTDRISSVSITLDGKHAVTSSLDNTSILWDLESGLRLKTFKRNFMMDSPLSLTPDGKCAISGSYHEDETYIIWDLEKGQVLKTISEQKVSIWTMIVSPDGKRAVSYSADTCNLWDIKSGKALKTLTGHIGHVISLNITPDGKRAVSISKDNTLILWNLENGKMLARFIGSFGLYVTSVFPKGIIVGGEGGKIVFLSVRRELLCPGPGIVTVRYIWEFRKHQYSGPYTDCPFCGKRFEPQKKMIETIRGILRNGNIGPNDSPCLKLPKEAWEEPGLLSKCPKCGEAIKFNPFIVEPT
jgi:WD40 repeat protein